MAGDLEALLALIRACRVCEGRLPHPPRPVARIHADARIYITGQAPGRIVHETGLPFNDRSGDRLRAWMGVDRTTFYDESAVAVAGAGLCFPGTVAGADLPPRPECAPIWQPQILSHLTNRRLTLLVGGYAIRYHLGVRASLTDTVRNWRSGDPSIMPLPHPSWRNTGWLKRNPWFEADLLPELRARVAAALS